MLISQAPLPWWGWLLCGMGGGIAALTASKIVDITEDGAWAMAWWLVGIMAGLGGCISFVIGLVRFAKWVWR
jgi:hypothetical protein